MPDGYKPIMGCYVLKPEAPRIGDILDEVSALKSRVYFLHDVFTERTELTKEGMDGLACVLRGISDTLVHIGRALEHLREAEGSKGR
ncbi:MAG: hypothetical protein H7843_01875 [Nitrospirota bacterium]